MRRAEENENCPMLVHGSWTANTTYSNLCHGGQEGGSTTLMQTDSETLLHKGVETALTTWQNFSQKAGWSSSDIDGFFCHQVGTAHARLLFETLGLDVNKNFETLPLLGNVGSVSAPITLAQAIEQQVFLPGQKGAMLGIGSGINCLMLGVEWRKHGGT